MGVGHHGDRLVAVPGLLTAESLGWAVRKDDAELRASVNGVLTQWQESGMLDTMIGRWIPSVEGE